MIDRLNALLSTLDPDVIILTEHGQKKNVLKNTRLMGYILKANFCRERHQKGGVAIYTKDALQCKVKEIELSDQSVEMVCEMAMVKLEAGGNHMYIQGVYRNQENLEAGLEIISQSLNKACNGDHPVILMGDVNVDCLNQDRNNKLLNDTLLSHNMTRVHLPPTRTTPTSQTSIDCVCSNLPQDQLKVEIIPTTISDHTGQLCTAQWQTNAHTVPPSSERRHMNSKNTQEFKILLTQIDWADVYAEEDVNRAYRNFNRSLQMALNQACPVVKTRNRKQKKKYKLTDRDAMDLKSRFLEAQELYNRTGREELKTEVAELKKNYDIKLKSLRRQATSSIIEEATDKAKSLWTIINSERKLEELNTLPNKLDIGESSTTDPVKIADHLNEFFISIGTKSIEAHGQRGDKETTLENRIQHFIPTLSLYPTNKEETTRVINSLKPKTSAGIDGISSKCVKTCCEELVGPLVNIANKSFASGIFPTDLKLAKVYAKYKQGCRTQASNYRPISLIPTFSKIMEKLVMARLMEHLTTNNLLTSKQHGFLPGRSTVTAIVSLVEFLIEQMEAGNTATAILLDYSKAFDCLDHNYLLKKLKNLGIENTALEWFRSYITERSQLVEVKHTSKGATRTIQSHPRALSRGVPQGSVLGPILFILFTNDFPAYLQDYSDSLMYADDTVLLLGESNPNELEVAANTALNMAIQYCHKNDLVVNEAKTKQIVIGRHKSTVGRPPEIEDAEEAKYLGIILDENLAWTQHIDQLCNKLSVGLYVIRRIKCISDVATAKIAYAALFESHLRYGIVVWGATTMTNMQRVLILQKRAIRILLNLQPRETCREAFKELKILTAINIYIMEAITYAHTKASHTLTTGAQTHQYNTRHAADYSLPVHRLSKYEEKPTYMGAKLWNDLPDNLKTTPREKFKHQLKHWLQEKPFYSITEFLSWKQQ